MGHFFFFSSTNVETKNVYPIAYNAWQLGEGGIAESKKLAQMFVPLLPNCLLAVVLLGITILIKNK